MILQYANSRLSVLTNSKHISLDSDDPTNIVILLGLLKNYSSISVGFCAL